MGLLRKKSAPVPRRRLETYQQGREQSPSVDAPANPYAFRRNRTLVGSLSSNVTSVNEHGAELKSPRVHAHHLRRHRRRAGLALFALLAICVGLGYLMYESIVNVAVTTSAPGTFNSATYQSAIHEYLMAHPLERFRFSLNTSGLTTYLQAHGYPEVQSIDPTLPYGGIGRADVHVVFRNPAVVWHTGGTVLYVDAQGNAFTRNYYQEPDVEVVDQTGIPANGGQVLASDLLLGFIGKVVGRMSENGLTVSQIILPPNTTHQVQVSVQGVSYPIKFSIDRPVGEQAEDAARAIRYLASKGISAQYLDVRVSGRAYYQ